SLAGVTRVPGLLCYRCTRFAPKPAGPAAARTCWGDRHGELRIVSTRSRRRGPDFWASALVAAAAHPRLDVLGSALRGLDHRVIDGRVVAARLLIVRTDALRDVR